MLDGFKVLPTDLVHLGFDLSDDQIGLAVPAEGWCMTWIDLDTAVDPYGMSGTWDTADGVPLRKIRLPIGFYFSNDTEQFCGYGSTLEDWVEDHYQGDSFWEIPRLLGIVDLPWHNHQGCGCDEDGAGVDAMPLWALWPITEAQMRFIDDTLMVIYDEFISDASKLIMYEEYYDLHDPDNQEDKERLQHSLFRPDYSLRVDSRYFDLAEFTDDQDLLDAWYGLNRSDAINERVWRNQLPHVPYYRTG